MHFMRENIYVIAELHVNVLKKTESFTFLSLARAIHSHY